MEPAGQRWLLAATYPTVDELRRAFDEPSSILALPFVTGIPASPAPVSVEVGLEAHETRVVVRGRFASFLGDARPRLVLTAEEAGRLRTYIALVRGEQPGAARLTRFPVDDVRVEVRSPRRVQAATVVDVSSGGCLLSTAGSLPETEAEVTLSVPARFFRRFAVRARVVWSEESEGSRRFGCSFSPGQDRAVERFVREILRR